ncbi:hypothetical protein DFH28DRAFT_926594 [Melampsora americana]|nr:hypothetical protein DFH28DRAFT_926594 [Melampsora americana]
MSQSATSTNGNQSPTDIGRDNTLFNRPSNIFEGADAPFPFSQGPLFLPGTDARKAFDQTHEVTIAVVFKIHTNSAEELAAPIPPKVPNGRRTSGPPKVPLVDSKTFNNGDPIELKTCPYGKSLNDMKKLCATLCEEYAPLMEQLLLNSPLAPVVEWKGVVGRTKAMKAQKKAQESAAKKLIATAAGTAPGDHEIEVVNARLEEAKKLVKLHETTAAIYHQHAEQSNGGDGVVLVAPWDPMFQYRFTLRCAFIWAKAIEQKLATIHMAPDTHEYRAEMAKSRVFHRSMRVQDRVQQRLAARRAARSTRPCFGKASQESNSPTPRGGQANCLVILSSDPDPDVKTSGKVKVQNRIGATSRLGNTVVDVKPKLPASNLECPILDVKPKVGNFEHGTGRSQGATIVLDASDTSDTSDGLDSGEEGKAPHEAALENFLYTCGVAPEDLNTRFGLAEAGVECWQDLIPSLHMTEGTLTLKGVDREIAGRLLARAQARHWRMMYRKSPGPSPHKRSNPQGGAGLLEATKVLHTNPFQQNTL